MSTMFKLVRSIAAIAAAVVFAGSVWAASGEFTFVNGRVTVQKANGQRVTPTKGTTIEVGDQIITEADGMAQLTMLDNARLSVRPNTVLRINSYITRPDGEESGIIALLKGTLRAFTGLLAERNREKFQMKSRVATVGVRGSGNILHTCGAEPDDPCDSELKQQADREGEITVNHTIEGSHCVGTEEDPANCVVTGPGQTVMVQKGSVKTIGAPAIILDYATRMGGEGAGLNLRSPVAYSAIGADVPGGQSKELSIIERTFAPADEAGNSNEPQPQPLIGNNGVIVNTGVAGGGRADGVVPGGTIAADGVVDVVLAAGFTNHGQADATGLAFEGAALRGYQSHPGTQSGLNPVITGGQARDVQTVGVNGTPVTIGRFEGGTVGLTGGSAIGYPGSVHFAVAPAGSGPYLSDVLTGTATYTLVAATPPTNQTNVQGTLGSATLNVNFSNRTASTNMQVSLPGTGGGTWSLTANNVPIALNSFRASTNDRLVIVNAQGQSSTNNTLISGSLDGSLVGVGLGGAIIGYTFADFAAATVNRVSGVAVLSGRVQVATVPYRYGLVSDPTGALSGGLARSYAVANRADEVIVDSSNRVTGFSAPLGVTTPVNYALGSATLTDSGFDPQTGLTWGRWSGGSASAGGSAVALTNRSLHYVFSGTQTAPVTLPLTGTASYEVVGNTSPMDASGNVGRLNSATLNANFSNRTVNAGVNYTINGQTVDATASAMPIYRGQFFSAYTGGLNVPGVPNPAPLVVSCTPVCANPTGSLDGFFTGRTGEGAGMMFNINSVTGAVALRRSGGR